MEHVVDIVLIFVHVDIFIPIKQPLIRLSVMKSTKTHRVISMLIAFQL